MALLALALIAPPPLSGQRADAEPAGESARAAVAGHGLLAPGDRVRLVWCADCNLALLTATGRVRERGPETLGLHRDAKFHLRLGSRDGRTYVRPESVRDTAYLLKTATGPQLVPVRPGWGQGPAGIDVPLSAITRLDARLPRSRLRGAGRGALLGVAAGAGGALLLLPAARSPGLDGLGAGIMAIAAMVLGPPVGAAVGAIFPGTRWTDVTDRVLTPRP